MKTSAMETGFNSSGRWRSGLIWALSLLLAFAPFASGAFAVQAPGFVRVFAHAHGAKSAVQDVSHHVGMDVELVYRRKQSTAVSTISDGLDVGPMHVHCEAACPSIMLPSPAKLRISPRTERVRPGFGKTLQSSNPDPLLRPPI